MTTSLLYTDPLSILNLTTAILSHSLPNCQLNRLQQIQNSLARAVVKAPKSTQTPILESLHWLKVNERFEYKLLSLTYKVLTTSQPNCLRSQHKLPSTPSQYPLLICCYTLSHPPTISLLKITDRSFRHASRRLWNQLPDSFRQPNQSCLNSPPHSLVNPSQVAQ